MLRRRLLMLTEDTGSGEEVYVDTNCLALYHFDQTAYEEVSKTTYYSTGVSYQQYTLNGKTSYAVTTSSTNGYIGGGNFVMGPFTIDFRVNVQYRDTNYDAIYSLYINDYNLTQISTKFDNSSSTTCKIFVDFMKNSTNYGDGTNYCATINTNQWYHFALTYDGSKAAIFIDGQKIKTYNNVQMTSGTYTLKLLNKRNNIRGSKCYLDEFHMSNSVLWTSNFTPPTEPWSIS